MNKKTWKTIINKLSTNSSGFTLVEILVAIVITGILVGGSGVALNTILRENVENEDEALKRQDTNRALSFIAEEIKMAQSISSDPSTDAPSGSSLSTGKDVETVLALTIPGLVDPIVYRVATPADDSVWQGPRVIYRWGPNMDAEGNYTDPDPSTEIIESNNWQNRPLVDAITNSTDSELPTYCSESADIIEIPNSQNGFYICLDSSNNRVAEVVIRSQLDNNNGSNNDYIETSVRTFARSTP